MEDPELVAYLRVHQVPLTVCPLSNIRLRVFDSMAEHNLKKLLKAEIRATVNSDDPAYFGGYIEDNYKAAQQALDLTRQHLRQLAENAIQSAFIDADRRQQLLSELARFSLVDGTDSLACK
jgi:adenosine deaminase